MFNQLKKNKELWAIYTRKEEYYPAFTDKHGRFCHYQSSNRAVMDPKVSRFLMDNGLKPQYPDDKDFAICLTHDIDEISFSIFRSAYMWYQKRITLGQAAKMPFHVLSKGASFLYNFKQIMDLESEYGAKSSFYILLLDKGQQDYTFNVNKIAGDLKDIAEAGWEVGLHGSHTAYLNPKEILEKKGRLEAMIGGKVVGYRNHYLKFKMPDTWYHLQKAGIKYDTTLGFIDCVGFRNGMCHPFWPYDLNKKRYLDVMEIPLNVMDCSLEEYMRVDWKTSWEITKGLIDTTKKNKGVLTFVWHNSYMANEGLKMYRKILKYGKEQNAWMTSGREVFENAKVWLGHE